MGENIKPTILTEHEKQFLLYLLKVTYGSLSINYLKHPEWKNIEQSIKEKLNEW